MGNVYHYRILVKPADPGKNFASDYVGYVWIVKAHDDDFIIDKSRMLLGG